MYYPFSRNTRDQYKINVTSNYGWRTINGVKDFHEGIDYAPVIPSNNIQIIAPYTGYLLNGKDKYGGLYCYIKGDDGKGYLMVHLSKFVRSNGRVNVGELVGYMGNTGHSYGMHVHYEVRADYRYSYTHIKPTNLTYYEKPMNDFNSFLSWNNAIKDKGLTTDQCNIVETGNPSGLVNKTEDLTDDQKEFCTKLEEFTNFIQNSGVKNTKWLDTVVTRYALYLKRSVHA